MAGAVLSLALPESPRPKSLLASRRRPWLAAAAGALFGLGYPFSQKAVYVGALGGAIALSDPIVDVPARRSREFGASPGASSGSRSAPQSSLWRGG